jgi:hypothetical protein
MKARPLPPIELLREIFDYDPESGNIFWKVKRSPKTGATAGYTQPNGRRLISFTIDGKPRNIQASRLAYALYHNFDPGDMEIDHINRRTDDNRITNLRLATRDAQNENRNWNNIKTAVRICYPDGRGEIIVDSIKTAARLLNRSPKGIAYILKNSGKLYWGVGGARQFSGIMLKAM